jgi:hypothetical protein
LMAIGIAAGAWQLRRRLAACIALGAAAVLIPLLAFAPIADVLIIAGGHLGELLFATYCFHHVLVGGKTGSPAERSAFAMAGMLLTFGHGKLCFGLMTSPLARALYATNGSLGLKNDYLRLAEDVFHCRLQSVALVMLVVTVLLPVPVGLVLGAWRARNAA